MEPAAPPLDLAGKRLFTVEEARALLPRVKGILARLHESLLRARELQDLLADAEAYYGGAVDAEGNPEREKVALWRGELTALDAAIHADAAELEALGCELKDVERGLVDFYHRRGDAIVCLCYERGEDTLGWWHPLDTGYAGRQPL